MRLFIQILTLIAVLLASNSLTNQVQAITPGCEDRDFNNDGVIDAADQQQLSFSFSSKGDENYQERFDLNGDGEIDREDLDLVFECSTALQGSDGTTFPSILEIVQDPLPAGKFTSLGQFASELLPFILVLGGMLAFLFLIWGGFKYMTAQGDPKAIDSARGTIVSAIIGLILLIAVFVILQIVGSVFKINVTSSLVPVAHAQVDIGEAFKFGGQGVKDIPAFSSLGSLLTGVANLAIGLAGVVFFFMLLWGSTRYMLSRGDDKMIMAARQTLANAVIGLLIVISAFAIIKLIEIATGANLSIF